MLHNVILFCGADQIYGQKCNIPKVAKYLIRGAFYCHKISKKYTAYEALELMKRWIQGKSLGPSTIETVPFTKYSLFTHSKKSKNGVKSVLD